MKTHLQEFSDRLVPELKATTLLDYDAYSQMHIYTTGAGALSLTEQCDALGVPAPVVAELRRLGQQIFGDRCNVKLLVMLRDGLTPQRILAIMRRKLTNLNVIADGLYATLEYSRFTFMVGMNLGVPPEEHRFAGWRMAQ